MTREPTPASALRARLDEGSALLLPGCADALTARVAADVGFEAVYATGAGIANALLGVPDVGLATLTEVVDQVRRMRDAVEIPIVADMDTGFGNAVNAVRALTSLERAGAAGVQIEDQVFPKRCGHFAGKEVIPVGEMSAKLRAVLDARLDPDTVVIARTDAIATEGIDAAVERANTYLEVGADLAFVEAPPTREALAELPRRVRGALVANMVEGGLTPLCTLEELDAMGYRVALFANTALRSAMLGMRESLLALRADGGSAGFLDRLISWDERQRLVGKPEVDRLEARYVDASERSGGDETSRPR